MILTWGIFIIFRHLSNLRCKIETLGCFQFCNKYTCLQDPTDEVYRALKDGGKCLRGLTILMDMVLYIIKVFSSIYILK